MRNELKTTRRFSEWYEKNREEISKKLYHSIVELIEIEKRGWQYGDPSLWVTRENIDRLLPERIPTDDKMLEVIFVIFDGTYFILTYDHLSEKFSFKSERERDFETSFFSEEELKVIDKRLLRFARYPNGERWIDLNNEK